MLEALIAERAFLAGVHAQAQQVIGRDACTQPLSVGMGALARVASRREVERVRRDERAADAGQARVHTGLSIVLQRLDYGSAQRVEFDMACDGQ